MNLGVVWILFVCLFAILDEELSSVGEDVWFVRCLESDGTS